MMRKLFGLVGLVFLLVSCAGPAAAGPKIHVEKAWARPAVVTGSMSAISEMSESNSMSGVHGSGLSSAAYFMIVNEGGEADTLTGVTMTSAGKASIHETQINNGIAKMVPVPSLEIPARGKVEFKPGSFHVMLEELTQELKEGQTLSITLAFTKSGPVTVNVPVQQPK